MRDDEQLRQDLARAAQAIQGQVGTFEDAIARFTAGAKRSAEMIGRFGIGLDWNPQLQRALKREMKRERNRRRYQRRYARGRR